MNSANIVEEPLRRLAIKLRYSELGRWLKAIYHSRLGLLRRESNFFKTLLRRTSPPLGLAFDLGAGDGSISRIFLKEKWSVVAVEPDARNIALLKVQFCSINSLHLVECAVGSYEGEINFVEFVDAPMRSSSNPKWIHAMKEDFNMAKERMVNQTTIENLINSYGEPQLIKIDIEGSEKEILLSLVNPIRTIFFEANIYIFREETLSIIRHLSSLHPSYRFTVYENYNLTSAENLSAIQAVEFVRSSDSRSLDILAKWE